jgi:Spx/MgsR family transcriptional regulator
LITLYGLGKCDTCAKARKWLDRFGVAHRFVDYKTNPVSGEMLRGWAATLGWDKLINRSGTTWRNLPDARKQPASDAEYVLLVRDQPSLVRRPVVVMPGGEVFTGFSDALYQQKFGTPR